MDKDIITKILDDNKELLSLPQTLAEVIRVTRKEDFSANQLADVLMRDPALTAKILRIVNSPFYGMSREVTSMTQAVVTLGTRQVTALALSSSVYNITAKWGACIDRVRFWRHSLEVAIGARMIAEAIGYRAWEELFVAGLLHDIGMLVLENSYPDACEQLWTGAEVTESVTDQEQEVWGTNHARVGQFLLEQWHLPAVICEAVGRHHHVFPKGSDNPETKAGQVVALANIISRFRVIQARPRDLQSIIEQKEGLLTNLGLLPAQLKDIEESLFARTVTEAAYLEIEVGKPEEIIAEANRMMFEQYLTVETLLRENRKMQTQIARDQIKKAALESLRTIAVTFNHYINNATAIISGRAQLIEAGIKNKQIADPNGQMYMAMQVIINAVETIAMVMDELKNLASFETTVYHEGMYILDIENKIKARLLQEFHEPVGPLG
ncbi:MAG: HDOD domain-containing protein [candidate division Zixibacteria bacterium]|jgi:putative nucleotidyltransferase with HDIG domain|nr:HDOD domain-containing protein [candidate division Zixibacteria bacterium]